MPKTPHSNSSPLGGRARDLPRRSAAQAGARAGVRLVLTIKQMLNFV
jgi:hypothetical protein